MAEAFWNIVLGELNRCSKGSKKTSPDGERLGPAHVQKVQRSNPGWRKLLLAEQYYVTRQQDTYYQIHEHGIFRCICCGNALFSSDTKFDSDRGLAKFLRTPSLIRT